MVTSAVAKSMLAGDTLQRFIFIAGHQPPDQTCAHQEWDLRASPEGRVTTKVVAVWKETTSEAKQERAEPTRWGSSMFDLFHTLQIYKPGVSRLVAQTGWSV